MINTMPAKKSPAKPKKRTPAKKPVTAAKRPYKLTTRQKMFIDYYVGVANLNATRACELAGYKGTYNQLAVQGSVNIRNPNIKARIEEMLNKQVMSASETLTILSKQARSSIADVLDEDGNFNFREAKKRGTDSLIKKYKTKIDQQGIATHELELHDAQAAAVHLGKVYGLFGDKVTVSLEAPRAALESFRLWLNDNPQATEPEKDVWLDRFAQGHGTDPVEVRKVLLLMDKNPE